MVEGSRKLRNALKRITTSKSDPVPDEWLNGQIEEIDRLNRKLHSKITLYEKATDKSCNYNCFMFALKISSSGIECWRNPGIQPDSSFVRHLLKSMDQLNLVPPDKGIDGDIAIYFDGRRSPKHAGILKNGRIVSKWGDAKTHVWEHGPWEVPISYGNVIKFYRNIPQGNTATTAFIQYAKAIWHK